MPERVPRCFLLVSQLQITAVGASASPFASCFFYSALNRISLFDVRTRAPVASVQLASSLGAVSSLVFGPPWPPPSPADSASSVLVAGTTRGFIPLYNMRYPLLVNLWAAVRRRLRRPHGAGVEVSVVASGQT